MALYVNGKQISGGGGGGNTNSVELTYAEYQALTPEQQLDGTEYFITDINGDGQDFQPIIYSEEEREIGVWADGKPLYEKTIDCGALPNNSTKDVAHGITDIDNIVGVVGVAYSSTLGIAIPLNYAQTSTNNSYVVDYHIGSTDVSIATYRDRTAYNGYVTLRYTKTTDQAGSGTWTPQGVPAHHYSNDEQVVGTWVDGSTLYEKTIEKAVTCGSEQTLINTTDIPNLNKIITVDGAFGGVPLNYYDTANYRSYIFIDNSNHTLKGYIKFGTTSSINSYFIIRYTKSTT